MVLKGAIEKETGTTKKLNPPKLVPVAKERKPRKPKVKENKHENVSEMWSEMGMMRCANCSFMTDQQTMFDSHEEICTKKSIVKKTAIQLLYYNNRYGCVECSFVTRTLTDFEEHIAFHLTAEPYICCKCVSTFPSKSDLIRHLVTKHKNDSVKCGIKGSKNIKFLLDKLSKDNVIQFSGRILDIKLWKSKSSEDFSQCFASAVFERSSDIRNLPLVRINHRPPVKDRRTSLTTEVPAKQLPMSLPNASIHQIPISLPNGNQAVPVLLIPVTMSHMCAPAQNISKPATTTKPTSSTETLFSVETLTFSKPVTSTAGSTAAPMLLNHSKILTMMPSTKDIQKSTTCSVSSPKKSKGSCPPLLFKKKGEFMICDKCNLKLEDQKLFENHIWDHIHTMDKLCLKCPPNTTMEYPCVMANRILHGLLKGSPEPDARKKLPVDDVSPSKDDSTKPSKDSSTDNDQVVMLNDSEGHSNTENHNNNAETQPEIETTVETLQGDAAFFQEEDSEMELKITSTYSLCDLEKDTNKDDSEVDMKDHQSDSDKQLNDQPNEQPNDEPSQNNISDSINPVEETCKSNDTNNTHFLINDDTKSVQKENSIKSCAETEVVDDQNSTLKGINPIESVNKTSEEMDHAGSEQPMDIDEVDAINVKETQNTESTGSNDASNTDHNTSRMQKNSASPTTSLKDKGNIFEKLSEDLTTNTEKESPIHGNTTDKGRLLNDTVTKLTDVLSKTVDELNLPTSSIGADRVDRQEQIDNADDSTVLIDKDSEKAKKNQPERVAEKQDDQSTSEDKRTSSPNKETGQIPVNEKPANKALNITEVLSAEQETQARGSFYICGFDDCGFRCMSSSQYRDHLCKSHGDATEFKCAHCGHKSLTEDCHARHMFGHSKSNNTVLYSCCIGGCIFGANVPEAYKLHWEKFHQTETVSKCVSCKEIFTSIDDLITHIQSNVLKFVQCPHCTVKDQNRRVIQNHLKEAHPGKPRQITVTSQLICQEREENAYVAPPLPSPIKIESGVDTLPQQASQEQHPRIEMNQAESNYEPMQYYDEDDSQYADNANYTDDLPFSQYPLMSSPPTSKTFQPPRYTPEQHINEAEKLISQDKVRLRNLNCELLKCSSCSYLASGKGILKKHAAVHKRPPTKESRPFKCPECPSTMDKLSKFSCHLNLHEGIHKIQIYFCVFCPYKSNVLAMIQKHYRKYHHFGNPEFSIDYSTKVKILNVTVKAYFCKQCYFGTRSKQTFDNHRMIHESAASSIPQAASHTITSPNNWTKSPPKHHPQERMNQYVDAQEIMNSLPYADAQNPMYPQKAEDGPQALTPSMMEQVEIPESSLQAQRFTCNLCARSFNRLPYLKSHIQTHVKDSSVEIVIFRCYYCSYMASTKSFVTAHSIERHIGKVVRVKRRLDTILPRSHGYQQPTTIYSTVDDGEDNFSSIETYHCDLCSFSSSTSDKLTEHKKENHSRMQPMSTYPPPGFSDVSSPKVFIVPYGNVYTEDVYCTECPFSTRLRIDLLQHLKSHPSLMLEAECTPRRDMMSHEEISQPQSEKERSKNILKVAFGKRFGGAGTKNSSSSSNASATSPPPMSQHSEIETALEEDVKPSLMADGTIVTDSVTKVPSSPTTSPLTASLFFLGSEQLNLKLKPCITDIAADTFQCNICKQTYEDKYSLHRDILTHMKVSFYRCAYCNHGELESSAIVVHIQKIHHKPIQNNILQIDLNDLESKINKSIHSMKELEYSGLAHSQSEEDSDCAEEDEAVFRRVDNPDPVYQLSANAKLRSDAIAEAEKQPLPRPPTTATNRPTARKSTSQKKTPLNVPALSFPSELPMSSKIKKLGDIYKCTICSYTTTARSTMLQHITIHSNFKRFGCPHCSYRTHWKHDCIKHIRQRHPLLGGDPLMDSTADSSSDREMSQSPIPSEDEPPIKQMKEEVQQSSPFKEQYLSINTPGPSRGWVDEELSAEDFPAGTEQQTSRESLTPEPKNANMTVMYKCLLCDTKFRSKFAIYKHFQTSFCSQKRLGCSLCSFTDFEPSIMRHHIETTHPANSSCIITTLNRDSKYKKIFIPKFKSNKAKPVVTANSTEVKPPAVLQDVESTFPSAVENDDQDCKPGYHVPKREPRFNYFKYTPYDKSRIVNNSRWNMSSLIKKMGNYFKCKDCGLVGYNKFTMMQHVKRHKMSRPYKCGYCHYCSNTPANVKRHTKSLHRGKEIIIQEDLQRMPQFVDDLPPQDKRRENAVARAGTINGGSSFKPSFKTQSSFKSGMSSTKKTTFSNIKQQTTAKTNPSYLTETKIFFKCLECNTKCTSTTNVYRHFKKNGCNKVMHGCSGCKFRSFDRAEVQTHVDNLHQDTPTCVIQCPSSAKIKKFHIPIRISQKLDWGEDSPNATSVKSPTVAPTANPARKALKSPPPGKLPYVDKAGTTGNRNYKIPAVDTNKKEIFCPVCYLKASNANVFQSHIESEHNGRYLCCWHCIYRGTNIYKLFAHIRENHPGQEIKFGLRFPKGFKGQNQTPSDLYKCPKCDFAGKRATVRNHLYCHFKYSPFMCGYCSQPSKKKSILTIHIERMHNGQPEKIIEKRDLAIDKEIEDLLNSNHPENLRRRYYPRDLYKDEPSESSSSTKMETASSEGNGGVGEENDGYIDVVGTESDVKPIAVSHIPDQEEPLEDYNVSSFMPTTYFKAYRDGKSFKKRFICQVCGVNVQTKKRISSHVYLHMPKVFKCPYCPYRRYPR